MDNVFTVINMLQIGGIETFLYNMARKYKEKDITVYYTSDRADKKQIERLRRYCNVVKYEGGTIKCKRVFFNYDLALIDNIEAEEYYQVIHCNYKLYNLSLGKTDKPLKYIAVSEHAARRFTEVTGQKCEVCYNPMVKEESKPLLLMSATRVAKGKGVTRIEKLAKRLDEAGVKYLWLIFGDKTIKVDSDNVIFLPPRLDIIQLMPLASWFVQLTDDEAFGTSIVESNLQGIPALTTPIPITDEFNIVGACVDYNVSVVPIEKLLCPEDLGYELSKWQPPKDRWGDLLV